MNEEFKPYPICKSCFEFGQERDALRAENEKLKQTMASYEVGYGVLVPSVKLKEMQAKLAEAERVITLVVKNAELLEGEDLMEGEKLARAYLTKYKKQGE